MAEAARDPREIITPDAFSVAPDLLGLPLARPLRRAVAMLIDLIAIAILTGAGWFFLGLGLAYSLFRFAGRPSRGAISKGSRWITFGSLGSLVLVVTLAGGWRSCFSAAEIPMDIGGADGVALTMLGEAGATVAELIALRRAGDAEEARVAALAIADRLGSQGVTPAEIAEVLQGVAETGMEPWAYDAIEAALESIDTVQTVGRAGADSLLIAYAGAVQAGDSTRAEPLRSPLVNALANDRLDAQRVQIERLRAKNESLEDELEETAQGRGLIAMILSLADEVGIGFGWAGLYFMFFPTFWRGMTPASGFFEFVWLDWMGSRSVGGLPSIGSVGTRPRFSPAWWGFSRCSGTRTGKHATIGSPRPLSSRNESDRRLLKWTSRARGRREEEPSQNLRRRLATSSGRSPILDPSSSSVEASRDTS